VISVTSDSRGYDRGIRRLGRLSVEYAKGAIGDEHHAGRHFNPQEPIARAKGLSVELATRSRRASSSRPTRSRSIISATSWIVSNKKREPPNRAAHSITSSARASSVAGTSRPSDFAVFETAVIPLVQSDDHHVQANLHAAKTTHTQLGTEISKLLSWPAS
jgi:hypothetical protein